MERLEIRKMLENLPHSYEDFVDSVTYEMERDVEVKRAITDYVKVNPDASPSDVLRILWKHLGIESPIEIVESEEYNIAG